jgi:hypothetical protein
MRETYQRLIDILQVSMSGGDKTSGETKTLISSPFKSKNQQQSDRFLYSGLELLTNDAFKNAPNECLIIGRNIESKLDRKKKIFFFYKTY